MESTGSKENNNIPFSKPNLSFPSKPSIAHPFSKPNSDRPFKHNDDLPDSPFAREQENLFAGLWMPDGGVHNLPSQTGVGRGRSGGRGGRRSSLKDIPLPPLPPGVQLPLMEPSAIKALAQKGRLDALFDPAARKDLISRGRNDTCEYCGKV